MNAETDKLPAMIAIRTAEFAPLLAKWKKRNSRAPWSALLRDALKKELKEVAGKRYAHIVAA